MNCAATIGIVGVAYVAHAVAIADVAAVTGLASVM